MTIAVMLSTGRPAVSLYSPERTSATALAWQDDALCATTDPDAFTLEDSASSRIAKRICAACPVREMCLEYALTNEVGQSIWGGLTVGQRRRIKRERAAA